MTVKGYHKKDSDVEDILLRSWGGTIWLGVNSGSLLDS